MAERKPISKKLRFEVFKRDKFTCQYCGRKAPDVVLNVDHIKPVAKGGTNNIFNLITSCFECNNGKRDIPLEKLAELDKERESLEMLEERKQQIDMLCRWKTEAESSVDYEIKKIEQFFIDSKGVALTDSGKNKIKKCIKDFGFAETLESTVIALEQYVDPETCLNYISGICFRRKEAREHPEYRDVYYLVKIGQSKCAYYDKKRITEFLKGLYETEDFDTLKSIFIRSKNWSRLRVELERYYGEEI